MWMAMNLDTSLKVVIMGKSENICLCYAEGMVGTIPVFETEQQAKDFVGDLGSVKEIKLTTQ